ncbi:hypothetical protein HMN09_00730400 [Mycena chlorophos]|uniref:protein-histidine N-methyltransferase n=1 Tax=Mycena chlorophos TaxID=658473 RepID=A0A8H6SVU7_MYCCL|nr:hypothetical protein HMN09_00730400 [Mycena chlorophos]
MFKFGFEIDEDGDISQPQAPEEQPQRDVVQVEPFSELSVAQLLDALPSQLSYSPLLIPLSSARETITLARRDLFDARFQLISAGTGADDEEPRNETESSALNFLDAPSDLVPGVYEGGLKTWECSLDLVHYVDGIAGTSGGSYFAGKRILEAGCGTAIPSTYILSQLFHEEPTPEGAELHLQDYNASVVELITFPNIVLAWYMSPASQRYRSSVAPDSDAGTLPLADPTSPGELPMTSELKEAFSASLELHNIRLRFFSGPWQSLAAHLLAAKYDIVLTSETIYRVDAVPALIQLLRAASGEQTICLVAAKVLYFGVGGGVAEFVAALEKESKGWGWKANPRTVWERTTGVGRKILQIEWT